MSVKAWEITWRGQPVLPAADVDRDGAVERDGGYERPPAAASHFTADLSGFEEVPPRLTPATGTFTARVSADQSKIEYELTFTGLTSPSTAAHIHFGQPGVNGEVLAFLCGGDDKPLCPGQGGRVAGIIEADDILAIPSQGVAAGDLAGALRIIRSGLAYVNVHSTMFPEGEIRGQIV